MEPAMLRSGRRRAPGAVRPRGAVALLAVVLGGCSPGGSATALPPPTPTVVVTMGEYRFDNPQMVVPGRTVFRVANGGALNHSLTLVTLPEDYPPIDEQLRSDTRRGAPTIARLPARGPGSNGIFAVDLRPGRYAMICFVQDPDGVSHSLKGMSSEFRVPG